MTDIIHEITRYAMRSSEPYSRWADEVSRLKIETAERQERNSELRSLVEAAYLEGYNDGYDDVDGYHDMSKASPDSCWKHSDAKAKLEQSNE